MIKALLVGKKTQTRRIVKGIVEEPGPYSIDAWERGEVPRCPYGQPGDVLYVKEDFWCVHESDGGAFFDLKFADGTIIKPPFETAAAWELKNSKRASWNTFRKHQQRFMPRWASRINLLIKDIRVERLQEISEEDAKAEGANVSATAEDAANFLLPTYRRGFQYLWNQINGATYPWTSDPFVWVISFEKAG